MEDNSFMQSSDMKRILYKVALFFLIVVLFDVCFGFICDYLRDHALSGDIKRFNDLIMKDRHDVLVFGSSRALYHYDSDVLEKNLNIECYNAGYGGHGIILSYPLLRSILERYKPRLIILEITKECDFLEFTGDQKNTRYISTLKPWSHIPIVSEIIRSVAFTDYILVHASSMFRYNSQIIHLIGDNLLSQKKADKGFIPLGGNIIMQEYKKISLKEKCKNDPVKVYWLKQFANLKNKWNLNMVWVISPIFDFDSSGYEDYEFVRDIAKSYDIPFFDYYLDSSFVGHGELFNDRIHLNSRGAQIFTERFATDLTQMKEKNNRK